MAAHTQHARRSMHLLLFTTDTPQVVEAATLMGWIHHSMEHTPQVATALETATIPVDYHQSFSDSAAVAAQIRQHCEVAAKDNSHASLFAVFCPTPAVAYHLLSDEPDGPPVAALVVVNAQEALPPSPQSVAAATPVKPGGKKAPEAKKAPPKVTKNLIAAEVEEDAEERDAFAVELAILCEGDEPSDNDEDAGEQGSQRAHSAAAMHPRLEANIEKQALFSVMDLVVVSIPHSSSWTTQLTERVVPCITNAVATTEHCRQSCERRQLKPFSVASADGKKASHPRGPWGLYHMHMAEEAAWSASTGSLPRSVAAFTAGAKRSFVGANFRSASPPREPQHQSAGAVVSKPKGPSRPSHSLAAASTLMAPGGNAAAYAARVASLVVDQTERDFIADAPVRHVIRIEKRHVPRESIQSASGESESASTSGGADVSHSTADSLPGRSSEFVAIHVPVGGLFEVPSQPASTEASTFDDVWAVVKATCGWGGTLSLPSAEPVMPPATMQAIGSTSTDLAPERPSTRRTTAFIEANQHKDAHHSDASLGGGSTTDELIPPRPPGSRGGQRGAPPSPNSHNDLDQRPRIGTPGSGERSRTAPSAVTIALASAFGRDAVETRLLAARAVRRWESAVQEEKLAVQRDSRGERADERLVREAKDHGHTEGQTFNSTLPSPGATLTFRPDTTGGMSIASRVHEAEDAAELRRAAHETVTIAETKFALLQARAQAVVDRIARAAAAAAMADAPAMAENLGFTGTVTRKSEAALGTQVAFRSTNTTRPATSQPLPTPCVAALAAASIDTTAYAFTQPVQHADVLRVVSDLEAPTAGQYISECVVLDALAVQRTVHVTLSAMSSTVTKEELLPPVTTPLSAPVRTATNDGGFESRPSSSGSVLRTSEVSTYRAPVPVALVCAARAVPPSGMKAVNTSLLLRDPLTTSIYQLMNREVVNDTGALLTPLNKFCTRWLNGNPQREVYGVAPAPSVVSEDNITWYLADSSVVTAHSNSAHAERRVSVSVADLVASMNIVPRVQSNDHDARPAKHAVSAVSTFPDGAGVRFGYQTIHEDGTTVETLTAHYTTRGGHVVGFAPFKESTHVTISRTTPLHTVVSVLDPQLKIVCRRHVQEHRRQIDRQTGRVHLKFSDGVSQLLDASTGSVCSYLSTTDTVTYLLLQPDGSCVGRIWRKDEASNGAMHQETILLPPNDVSRAHDTETKSDIWSRADGTIRVTRVDGCSISTFPDGTRVVINRVMATDGPLMPEVQIESPAGPSAPPVPAVAIGSDGLLSLFSADSGDTLVERINPYGRDELLLSRRTGTTIAVDMATHVVMAAPWTLPSCLGATEALATLQSVPKKELIAALVGVHVFDLSSGGYRCLDLDMNEVAVGLSVAPVNAKRGLVKPLESLHVGITPSPASFVEYATVTLVDIETRLLKIAGQKKVVPPRASPKGLDSRSQGTDSRATTRQSQRSLGTTSPGSDRSGSQYNNLKDATCDARVRTICNPIVAHYDLLAYNNVKQREAARRADAKQAGSPPAVKTPGCRPVLFAFFDDGTVNRLLTAADIAPLVRHALGTSSVTLARSVVGGEPGIQQITYLLDASKALKPSNQPTTKSTFVKSTKQGVLQSQSADNSDAPPAESLSSNVSSATLMPSGLSLFDTTALIPRGLLPPAHITAQFEAAIAEANPAIALNFTRYGPIAPLIRQALIKEAVAAMDAKHSAELYGAALLVPDYRPPEERDANERLAEKHAYKIAQLKAARVATQPTSVVEPTDEDAGVQHDEEENIIYDGSATANKRAFASTVEATLPIRVTPSKLQPGTLPRGYKYQMFLTIENTSTSPVTVTVKRAAALLPAGVNRHPVEVQSGRGVVAPLSSIRIGIVLTASNSDAANIRCNLVIETSISRGSLLVPFTATLVSGSTVDGDVAKIADKLPTSVKVIGVASA